MGYNGSVAAFFQKLELDKHPIAKIINQAIPFIPKAMIGGKLFVDMLGSMENENFQEYIAEQGKLLYIDKAKALHRVDRTVEAAQREAERIDDKVHQQAHFWLTVLPTDGQLFIGWQDAQDFTAWYFGVPIREPAPTGWYYCRHPKTVQSNQPKLTQSQAQRPGMACCGTGYKHNDNHIFGCQHAPKITPHNRLRDRLAACMASVGLPIEREARAPEFGILNGKDTTSQLDIKIQNFGKSTQPVFIDVSVRALRSMRSEGTNKCHKEDPLEAGDLLKQKTYPVTSKDGHMNVNAQLFPVVFSPWGGLSPKGTEFFACLSEVIGPTATLRIKKVMSVEFVRSIAYKLRHGAGVPLHHPDKKATAFDIQAAARGFPGEVETSPLFFSQDSLRGVPVALSSAGPHPVAEAAKLTQGSDAVSKSSRAKAKVTKPTHSKKKKKGASA